MKDIQGIRRKEKGIRSREKHSAGYSLGITSSSDLIIIQHTGGFKDHSIYIPKRDLAALVQGMIDFLDEECPEWRCYPI